MFTLQKTEPYLTERIQVPFRLHSGQVIGDCWFYGMMTAELPSVLVIYELYPKHVSVALEQKTP